MKLNFKNFLLEKTSDLFHVEEAKDPISLLKENGLAALRAIKNGTVLYRGMGEQRLRHPVSIISVKSQRVSRDTNNIYQLMMDASPALSEFPSRSKSLICSTRIIGGAVYGDPYVILPFDDTDIAVSSESDFPVTDIDNYGFDLYELSQNLGYVLEYGFGIRPESGKTYLSIDRIDSMLSKVSFDSEFTKMFYGPDAKDRSDARDTLIALLKKQPKDKMMSSLAAKLMTPKNLKLSLARFGSIHTTGSKEVWFDGKALALYPSAFLRLINTLQDEHGFTVSPDLLNIDTKKNYYF